ncbi:MAG TPA: copper-containing nitrite reductase [Candidatus Limnocylindrales bacterium]|nr:copper-containing nitrite reductase [Candidatus Limnocylindrales bacterium]
MRSSLRIIIVLIAASLTVACAGKGGPTWTYRPDASEAPAPASPTAPGGAMGTGSVIPDLTPKAELEPVPTGEVNVAYAPSVPPAATRTSQAIVDVQFDIVEGVQAIDPARGIEYTTWGYRIRGDDETLAGTPGPIVRARVGDVLRFTISNLSTNSMPHNVDFHAVTGQGGGAADTTVNPGETAVIEGRLLYPGMFMYHCAAGDVPGHIAQGMYGGILVDPAEPLPPVEHELYMVQSEYYTTEGADGSLTTDRAAMTDEHPSHVVFNGAVGALTGDNAPRIEVGETMRIYFVNAGLNLDSNFHPIGSHWDKVYQEGALLNAPLRGSQTTLVPAGGGTVVELIGQVPATIVLVDHALTRAFDKGAIGQIVVTGDQNPEIFEPFGLTGSPAPASPGASATPSPADTSAPSESPAASGSPAPSGSPSTVEVSILAGSSTFQDADAPDEFAETEAPADYSVNELMITLGTTVTWTNNDTGMVHTVTAVDGSFDSAILQPGQSFSYTFNDPGDFEYFCSPHPWMRARVSVMMH